MSKNNHNKDSALHAADGLHQLLTSRGIRATVRVDGNKGTHNWHLVVYLRDSARRREIPAHHDHFTVVVQG